MITSKLRLVFTPTCFSRTFSVAEQAVFHKQTDSSRMKAWQVHSYDEDMQLTQTRVPFLNDPQEVLIKVEAASINPIDNYMRKGYGRTLFQIQRNFEMELPLTLGRDFCGIVVKKGVSVGNFNIGDKVYGFVPVHKPGSFAEFVVAQDKHILPKPGHLTEAEATSIVYAAMTAYGALFITGNLVLKAGDYKNTRVLILGASGGVGTVATQILASQNIFVTGTCSKDAIPLVQSLGAQKTFDYREPDYLQKIAAEPKYDIILDCAKFGVENLPSDWKFNQYITLNSPLLSNTDKQGLVLGLMNSGMNLMQKNLELLRSGKSYKWGFFMPSTSGFSFIDNLILNKKIRPIIHKEFSFNDLPMALEEVSKGHLRGKVVVNFNN